MDALKDAASFALGILGIIVGYILYRRGRREKKPLWSIKNNNLISGFSKQLPSLDVKYAGQNVENLSVGKVVFWNGGSETIRREDIANADPIRIIALNNTTLLDTKLLEHNSNPSLFLISKNSDSTAAFIEFDFVDRNQGLVVQVVHTGTSGNDLILTGTIKGAGTPKHSVLGHTILLHTLQELAPITGLLIFVLAGLYVQTTFGISRWLALVSPVFGIAAMIYLTFKLSSLKLQRIPKQLRSHLASQPKKRLSGSSSVSGFASLILRRAPAASRAPSVALYLLDQSHSPDVTAL